MRIRPLIGLVAIVSWQPLFAQAQVENHSYDELGRLKSTTNTGSVLTNETRSICYDGAGNRVEFEVRTDGTTTTCTAPTQQTPPAGPPEPTEEPLPDPPTNYAPTTVPDGVLGDCGDSVVTDVVVNDDDAEGDTLTLISIVPEFGDASANASISNASGLVLVTFPASASRSRTFIYTIQDTANNEAEGILWVRSDEICS